MMLLTYLAGSVIKELRFDATVSESHSSTASVTSHPVEVGQNITDHVRPDPEKLSVNAMVSNTPLFATTTNGGQVASDEQVFEISENVGPGIRVRTQKVASVTRLRFPEKIDRVRDVYTELRRLQETGTRVDVRTIEGTSEDYVKGLRDYTDMVIVNISVPRSVADGTALAFSFDVQKIRFAETKFVAVQVKKKEKKRGEKGKGEVTDKTPKRRSLAKSATLKIQEIAGVGGL